MKLKTAKSVMDHHKILFIAPGDSPHTVRWIERTQNLDFEVVLLSQDGIVPKSSFPVVTLTDFGYEFSNNPILNLMRSYFALKKIINYYNPDLIHLHWLFSPTALALSFIKDKIIIATPWGSDVLHTNEKNDWSLKTKTIYYFSIKRTISGINYFTCDGLHIKEKLLKLGVMEKNIKLIYFGTDSEFFSPKNRSEKLRESWGASGDKLVILSNRQLHKVYNIETMLYSFADLKLKFNNLILVIGGTGPEYEKLKELAIDLKIIENVVFLGILTNQEVANSVASCDVYVSTSTSDGGLASSVAEAMASAIPVIITDFGVNSLWLEHESAGFIFPIGDSKTLTKKIENLIVDLPLRKSLGTNGRRIVKERLNPNVESQKLKNFYLSLTKMKS
jgi:L-malate glycosyltransferase